MPLPPSLDALQPTWAEYSVCAKAQVAVLLALNGRNMRQIKSHALVYFNEKPAVECLPRDLGPEDYFVVFAKLTDSEVVTAKKNRLLVRRVVTDALLKIYRDNIDVYFQKLPSSKTVCTPPLFVLVELTSTPLKGKPPGQPPNLPPNVVALPMYKHNKASINVTNVANNTRHSVTVRLYQLPFRPANALTTYAEQGSQFDFFVIRETNEGQFYTQISRVKHGLETISITTPSTLKEDFAPATQEDTEVELERLREQYVKTEATFEQETRQLPHRST